MTTIHNISTQLTKTKRNGRWHQTYDEKVIADIALGVARRNSLSHLCSTVLVVIEKVGREAR